MLKRYPRTLRWRQALPPLFVSSLAVFVVLSLWFAPARYLLAAQILAYLAVLGFAAVKLAFQKGRTHLVWGLPLAVSTMHLAWGAGFLWSGISSPFERNG
jgi:hypothetical protein